MKVKHLAIAVAVLAVASAATWLAKRGDSDVPTDPRVGQPLVDDALVEKIAAVTVHTKDSSVEVARSAEANNRWIVRSYHDLPADFSKLSTLIKNLREAKVVQFASARPERLEQMDFDGSKIELRDADGNVLRTLHVGGNYESGGRFIKFDDEAKAYVASLSAYLDGTAKNWANTALVNAKPEEVVGLDIGFPDGSTLKLKRENGTAPWTAEGLAEGEKLKESDVNSLVSRLTGLRFSETADPTDEQVVAAREHARTLKLTLTTGKSYEISMGRKPAPPPPPKEETREGEEDDEKKETAETPKPGPVYVHVESSDANDPINASMARRAFEIYEWTFTSLPENRAALIEKETPAEEADENKTSTAEPAEGTDESKPSPAEPAEEAGQDTTSSAESTETQPAEPEEESEEPATAASESVD